MAHTPRKSLGESLTSPPTGSGAGVGLPSRSMQIRRKLVSANYSPCAEAFGGKCFASHFVYGMRELIDFLYRLLVIYRPGECKNSLDKVAFAIFLDRRLASEKQIKTLNYKANLWN